ncbi:MAG: helix-turn-helix transcriptional regulator [Ruthenibacterium sp.]
MTDELRLKAAIVLSGLSRQEVADSIGISLYSLHLKLHNKREFKPSEIAKLSKLLNIEDKDAVFFVEQVN